jgi:single-strand DNA-binding protein
VLPRVAIDGRLAADPELRFGTSGTPIANLRLVASDRRLNQASGEWEDGDVLWIDVTCFKQLAENVVESFTKGDLVLVYGKLKTDEWQDREGGKRSKIMLIADAVGASVQFRTLPHAGATHAARGPANTYRAPVEQAYSGSEEPPF